MISEEPSDTQRGDDKGHRFHSFWEAIEAQAQIRAGLDDQVKMGLQQRFLTMPRTRMTRSDYSRWVRDAYEMPYRADPFFVDREVCPTIYQLGNEIPNDYALSATDFPVSTGFILLANPFWVHTRKNSPYSAFSWQAGGERVFVAWWINNIKTGWMIGAILNIPYGQSFNSVIEEGTEIRERGEIVASDDNEVDSQFDTALEYRIKAFAGTLIFMNSKLTTTTEFSLPRQVRRRMETVVRPETSVRVVSLRKTEQQNRYEGDVGSIEFTHRFIVNGHWRKQCMVTAEHENGRCWHRPTWIAPFIKGPNNKPLAMPQTIYNVMR